MKPIYKLINAAQEIRVKTSGLTAIGTPMAGESDNSNPTEVSDNLQNGTSPDCSLVSGNTEKSESQGTLRPSETSIKSDSPKKSSKDARLKIDFSDNGLVQGFIMSEILAHPKAMKRRGNTIWNSRF